jgi:glycosyltransferase involved in cell wall biosynthesis
MIQNPSLTIIIVTHNSAKIIKSCLEVLNFEKYKVMVVDNSSKDGTAEFVRQNFPQVLMQELPKNIGYGNGNNVALNQVETEFALILNPDAVIFEKDIEIVLEVMKKNPLVAMAGPVVLNNFPIEPKELAEKIVNMEQDLAGIKDVYYEKIDGNFSVRFLIGAALFMQVAAMKKIGFFDKEIFLYYEDDEICGRVRANGFCNFVISSATAFHIGGGGKSSGSGLKVTYKKSWHLTWSKLYWKYLRKGKLRAKRSAFKFALVYLVKSLVFALRFDAKKLVKNLGACAGSLAFFIGLRAFDKNGNSRG